MTASTASHHAPSLCAWAAEHEGVGAGGLPASRPTLPASLLPPTMQRTQSYVMLGGLADAS